MSRATPQKRTVGHRARLALALAAIVAAIPLTRAGGDTGPTLQADRPCYTPGERMELTGAGYGAGSSVAFFFQLKGKHGNDLLGGNSVTADPTGAVSVAFGAPKLASSDDIDEQLFITAAQQPPAGQTQTTGPAPFGAANTIVSVFGIDVAPWDSHQVDPRKTVVVAAAGYEPATKLWAHYVLNGKRVKSVLVGSLNGPCGDLTKHMREFPFRPVRAGNYTVYFTGSQQLDKHAGAFYRNIVVSKSKAIK